MSNHTLKHALYDFHLLMLMKGTEVPNPRRSSACDCTCVLTRIDHCLMNNRSCHACQMCLVLFLPVQSLLTCLFQKLSYSFCGLCLSLSPLITLPQTVRLFYISLRSQAPQQQYTVLSFLRCEGMATVTN